MRSGGGLLIASVHSTHAVPFSEYVRRVLDSGEAQLMALFGDSCLFVSVDGQIVEGPDSAVPVSSGSRVVLYRRQGPMLDVLNHGVVRRICLN